MIRGQRVTKEWMAEMLRQIHERLGQINYENAERMRSRHEHAECQRIINSISAYSARHFSRSPQKKAVALEIQTALARRWDQGT